MSLRANFHTHTTFCDGLSTPREIVEEALRLGLTHLGFSGHMDDDIHMEFDKYVYEINELKDEFADKIEILCGVELDTLYDPTYATNADYVIGSTHFLNVNYDRPLSIDDTPEDVVLLCNEFFGGDYYRLCKEYYELEATVCDRFQCTFIGHFDLVTKFNNDLHFIDEDDKRYLVPAYEAMRYIVGKGIPFEINMRQVSRNRLFPKKELLQYLKELGGEIVINSDAHNKSELIKGFDCAIEITKECGFDHTNYLTKKNGNIDFMTVEI